MMELCENIYSCQIAAEVAVLSSLNTRRQFSADGRVIGFQTPDGSIVKPVIAFEMVKEDGSISFICGKDSSDIGISVLDYEQSDFVEPND